MPKIFVAMHNFARTSDPYVMPPFYEAFLNGLKEAGNEVFCFFENFSRSFEEEIPHNILKKIKSFDPDLFIFFNNAFWDITAHFDRPIVAFDIDSVNFFKNREKIRKHSSRYLFLTFQKEAAGLIQDLYGASKKSIRKITPFTGIKADPCEKQSINISFLGWNWMANTSTLLTDFIKKDYTPMELETARQVYDSFIKFPFKTIENIYAELGYDVENKLTGGCLQCDTDVISGIRRARYLTAVADLGLDLRGMGWNDKSMTYFPELHLRYNKTVVFSLLENQQFYNRSKIGFNTNHIQAQSGFSWRVCDIMASNACLVSEYKPGLSETFPGIPLPTFTSPAEAREQCLKILKEENLRQDIVAASHEEIDKKHRFKNIFKEIEDFLQMRLHSDKEGLLELFYYDAAPPKKKHLQEKKIPFKDRLSYKIWRILNKRLSKKGLI